MKAKRYITLFSVYLIFASMVCTNCYSQSTDNTQFIMADSIIGSFREYSKGVERTITLNKNKTFTEETLLLNKQSGSTWVGHWHFSKDTLILIQETLIEPDGKTYTNDGKTYFDKHFYKNNGLYNATYGWGWASYIRLKPKE